MEIIIVKLENSMIAMNGICHKRGTNNKKLLWIALK